MPIIVKTLDASTPSPGVDLPYNMTITSINGSEIALTAQIDSIDNSSGSLQFELRPIVGGVESTGSSGYIFSDTTLSKTYNFNVTGVYPQNIDAYVIAVTRNSQELGKSNVALLNFTGPPESNTPPAPTGLYLSTSSSPPSLRYDKTIDDSGVVHHYDISVTGPSFSFNDPDHPTTGRLIYGLTTGVNYTATVKAVDIWGNVSAASVLNFLAP